MSNVVDDRVVKMKFDNEEFDSNVKDTMKSLDDLDKSLKNMDKGSYGDNLGNALGGIGTAVDDLSERFSAWGIVGMEVIKRLTDFAIDKGAQMVKALSIDQVTEGWSKYESLSSNIYAISNQVSHGETFEDVTRAIEKLSWYSDATSFSLTNMTSALTSFISQGIDLDTATSMIMGMGNSITYAGANAKDGSGAFDVFSKAFGQGYIGLKQWNQLSSTYRVGTYELKQQALDTAVALGKLSVSYDETGEAIYQCGEGQDALIFKINEFDTTLGNQKGKWLDRDVLMALYGDTGMYGEYISGLSEYIQKIKETTGEQLTWNEATERYAEYLAENGMEEDEFGRKVADSATVAKTLTEAIDAVKDAASSQWERIFEGMFGTVDKAKEVWSSFSDWLNNLFVGPLNNVANIITTWAKLPQELGGQESFIQIFRNLAAAAERAVAPIKRAWEVIHGSKTTEEMAAKLGEVIRKIELFTESLFKNEEVAAKFQRVWEVIFEVLKTVGAGIGKILGLLKAAGTVIKPIIGFLGDLVAGIAEVVDIIFKVFNLDGNLWGWLNKPTNALKKLGASLSDTLSIFNIAKGPVVDGVANAFDTVGAAAGSVGDALSNTGKSLSELWEEFKNSEGFTKFKTNAENAYLILGQLNGGFLNSFKDAYSDAGGGIVGVVKGAYQGIKTVVGAVYDALGIMLNDHFGTQLAKIKEFAGKVETKVSELAGKIKNLGSQAMAAITGSIFGESIFGDVAKTQEESGVALDTLAKMRQNIDKEMKSVQSSGKAMSIVANGISAAGIGGAFLRINQILKNVAEMLKSMKDMWGSIGGTFSALTNSLKTMQLEVKADIIKDIAIALGVLAASLVAISLIPTEKLGPAIAAITALIIEMGILMGSISNMDFGSSTMKAVNKGVLGKTFEKTSSNMTKAATTILEMSAAVLILATAMKQIADIPTDKLVASISAVSALMLELWAFAKFTDSEKGGLGGNVGMNVFKMASGLVVMAQAMKMLAELDDDKNSLGKGLGAVGGILTMLFTFSAAMQKWGGGKDMGDMGSLISLAAGLAALALVIKIFANIPTDQLIKGGVAVAACLTGIWIFMAAMGSLGMETGDFAKISASLVVFGAALLVMAGALTLFNLVQWDSLWQAATALGLFIAAVKVVDMLGLDITMISFAAAVALFGVGIGALGAGLLAAATALTLISVELPLFIAELVETFRALLAGIISLKPEIVVTVISLVEALCEAIVGSIETILTTLDTVALAIFEHFLSTLSQLIDIFEKYWPKIRAALVAVGSAIMGKLKEWAPKIWNWLKETLTKIGTTIYEKYPEWLEKLGDFFIRISKALGNFAIKMLAWAGNFLIDLLKTFVSKALEFRDVAIDYMVHFWDGLGSKFTDILKGIGDFIISIIKGIIGFGADIFNAGVSLIDNLLGGIFSRDKDVYNAGAGTADQYNQGINDKSYESKQMGERLSGNVIEGTESADFYSAGVNAIQGFIQGLKDKKANRDLIDRAKEIGGLTERTLKNSLQEKSPSKKMEYIGKMALEGYNKGLLSKTEYNDIMLSAEGLGGGTVEYTIEGLKSKWPDLFAEIDNMEDEVEAKFANAGMASAKAFVANANLSPVITPVVDLTEVEAGVAKINYMTTALATNKVAFPTYTAEELRTMTESQLAEKGAKEMEEFYARQKAREEAEEKMRSAGLDESFILSTLDSYFGVNTDNVHTVKYLKSTIDLAAAAAAGLLTPELIDYYNKNATPEDKARTTLIINQHNESPKALDEDEIYRNTEKVAKYVLWDGSTIYS